MVGSGCGDDACLSIATYRLRSPHLRRVVWRRLPVDTSAGGVALLVDGEVTESAGNGWPQVAAALPAAPAGPAG